MFTHERCIDSVNCPKDSTQAESESIKHSIDTREPERSCGAAGGLQTTLTLTSHDPFLLFSMNKATKLKSGIDAIIISVCFHDGIFNNSFFLFLFEEPPHLRFRVLQTELWQKEVDEAAGKNYEES